MCSPKYIQYQDYAKEEVIYPVSVNYTFGDTWGRERIFTPSITAHTKGERIFTQKDEYSTPSKHVQVLGFEPTTPVLAVYRCYVLSVKLSI